MVYRAGCDHKALTYAEPRWQQTQTSQQAGSLSSSLSAGGRGLPHRSSAPMLANLKKHQGRTCGFTQAEEQKACRLQSSRPLMPIIRQAHHQDATRPDSGATPLLAASVASFCHG